MAVKGSRILSYEARDGFKVDALLTTPHGADAADLRRIPVIINIHGVLGNFLARGTPKIFPSVMLARGYSTLSINTRMAFLGQIMGTGIFPEAAWDVECSVRALTKEGFENIYILGYSMGANIAVDYVDRSPDSPVKGLILEGCSYSLPESQKKRLDRWQSIPRYDDVCSKARMVLGAEPEISKNDQIFIIYRAWGDSLNPSDVEMFTYKTWWFMRGPEAARAKTCDIMDGVSVPVLFIHGADDDIVFPDEPRRLAEILKAAGNSAVDTTYVPDAAHDCMENPDFSADVIDGWIKNIEGRKVY